MKSPWIRMVVMVTLGPGLVAALSLYETLTKLSGSWVPLATAREGLYKIPIVEFSITPTGPQSFAVIHPQDSNGNCVNTWLPIAPDKEENFMVSGYMRRMRILETDYKDYQVIASGKGSDLTLMLYAECRLTTYY